MRLLTVGLILIGIITLVSAWWQRTKCKHTNKLTYNSKGLRYYNIAIILLFLGYFLVEYFSSISENQKMVLLAIIFVLETIAWYFKYHEKSSR